MKFHSIFLSVLLFLPFIVTYKVESDLIVQHNEPREIIRCHRLKSTRGENYNAIQKIPYTVPPKEANRLKTEYDPIIDLNEPRGKIRGHILKSTKGKDYYAFQEIPYAAPPIGKNRFKLPKKHDDWDGILNTTENTKQCMQQLNSVYQLNNTEDCLYINVYTPVKPGRGKLPVLFFIHGGSFVLGYGAKGQYGPDNFMDFDIVVVTINYRLGPFGLLSTGDGIIPSNLAFKDQRFALNWVQTNIHLFSGDPTKVTLWGESAGASSVSYHLLDKKSIGLFRAAIMSSATSLTRITYNSHKKDTAIELVKKIYPSFHSNSSMDILNLLMNCSAEEILNAAGQMQSLDRNIGIVDSLVWASALESEDDPDPVLTTPYHKSFLDGNFTKVPLMYSFNSEEILAFIQGSLDSVRQKAADMDKDDSLLIDDYLNIDDSNKEIAGKRIKNIYTNGTFENDLGAFIRFSSDEPLRIGTIREAEVASKYVPVYLLEFSYAGIIHEELHYNYSVPGIENVGHSEELYYLWYAELRNFSTFQEKDRLVSARLLKLITNFVNNLDPTPQKDELLNNITWPTLNGNSLMFLNISNNLEVSSNPTRYRAYRDILLDYIKKPFIIFS